jgi:hypothetical protein
MRSWNFVISRSSSIAGQAKAGGSPTVIDFAGVARPPCLAQPRHCSQSGRRRRGMRIYIPRDPASANAQSHCSQAFLRDAAVRSGPSARLTTQTTSAVLARTIERSTTPAKRNLLKCPRASLTSGSSYIEPGATNTENRRGAAAPGNGFIVISW